MQNLVQPTAVTQGPHLCLRLRLLAGCAALAEHICTAALDFASLLTAIGCIHLQVREYEEVMSRIQPVFKPLLKPHLADMEKKVAPGMFVLTWTSMNIDGYLHRFKQVRERRAVVRHHTVNQPATDLLAAWLHHSCCHWSTDIRL
jgi:hypothetical protein